MSVAIQRPPETYEYLVQGIIRIIISMYRNIRSLLCSVPESALPSSLSLFPKLSYSPNRCFKFQTAYTTVCVCVHLSCVYVYATAAPLHGYNAFLSLPHTLRPSACRYYVRTTTTLLTVGVFLLLPTQPTLLVHDQSSVVSDSFYCCTTCSEKEEEENATIYLTIRLTNEES